jgi:hypothetical protein
MKTCSKCNQVKAEAEFGTRHRSIDGLQAWCRDCLREYQREYARNYRDLERHRNNQKRYLERNRHKGLAHQMIGSAVRKGAIFVPLWCQRCGCVNHLEAHHNDYNKPLEVEWLCTTCHGLAHRSYREVRHA